MSTRCVIRGSANSQCHLAGLSINPFLLISLRFFVSEKGKELHDKPFHAAHLVCEDVGCMSFHDIGSKIKYQYFVSISSYHNNLTFIHDFYTDDIHIVMMNFALNRGV